MALFAWVKGAVWRLSGRCYDEQDGGLHAWEVLKVLGGTRDEWWKVGALPLIVCSGVTVVRAHSDEKRNSNTKTLTSLLRCVVIGIGVSPLFSLRSSRSHHSQSLSASERAMIASPQ